MDLAVDPSSRIPLYVQIVEQIRRLVALGALRAGDRLPTVRELAVSSRINRNTAARAIRELERAGVVRTRVGQGTFVVDDGLPRMDPAKRERALEQALDRLLVEAHTLGAPLEELGWQLSRRIEVFLRRRRVAGRDVGAGAEEDTP